MTQKHEIRLETVVAVYIINKHAKTALEPSQLYTLKQQALKKMIRDGFAQKTGIHQSLRSHYAKKSLSVLVEVTANNKQKFCFHLPPDREDFLLPNLGTLDTTFRNPKIHMSLTNAKKTLHEYLGTIPIKHSQTVKKPPNVQRSSRPKHEYDRKVFVSTFLDISILKH